MKGGFPATNGHTVSTVVEFERVVDQAADPGLAGCGARVLSALARHPLYQHGVLRDVATEVACALRISEGAAQGQGEHIACNKVKGVRAGLCHDRFTTEISRGHNDSNVLILGSKVIGPDLADELTDLWMATPFKGGVHQDRLDQIAAIERGEIPHRVKP